jgi:hypothetical protein
MFISPRVVSDKDLARVIRYAGIATLVNDAVGPHANAAGIALEIGLADKAALPLYQQVAEQAMLGVDHSLVAKAVRTSQPVESTSRDEAPRGPVR